MLSFDDILPSKKLGGDPPNQQKNQPKTIILNRNLINKIVLFQPTQKQILKQKQKQKQIHMITLPQNNKL